MPANGQLYMAKITRKEDPNFPNATLIEEEVLLPSKTVERRYPQYSPDGKEIAFIEDRNRLMVLNLETKKVRQVTDGSTWYNTGGGFDYEWSPDGKWFTLEFIGNRHDPVLRVGYLTGTLFFSKRNATGCVPTLRGVHNRMLCWYS